MPLGFKTGAGVIFGVSGGVTEAVLRYAVEKVQGTPLEHVEFEAVRGESGLREIEVPLNGTHLRHAIVYGLANARKLLERLKSGECHYDLIEVMACPGGCIAGAGQPPAATSAVRRERARALYRDDKELLLHKSQDNTEVMRCYERHLGEIGGETAHNLLHTTYQNRRRVAADMALCAGEAPKVRVEVCVGTTCFLHGSQKILQGLLDYVDREGLHLDVEIRATFCLERCGSAPNVRIGATVLSHCTLESALEELNRQLAVTPV